MKVIFIIIIFFVIWDSCYSQSVSHEKVHGTLLVSVICQDGILIAADSRASYTCDSADRVGIVYAYLDSTRKIFRLGNFHIACAGTPIFKNKMMENIVPEYNRTHKNSASVLQTFNTFLNYLKINLKATEEMIRKCTFIICGYENNSPVMYQTDSVHREPIKWEGMTRRIYSLPAYQPYFRKYMPATVEQFTCEAISKIMDKSFNEYSIKENDMAVGGPLHIIKISKNNSTTTLKEFKFKTFKNYKQLEIDILNKKIEMRYLYSWSRELLVSTLRKRLSIE